jgi:hypothetical protein
VSRTVPAFAPVSSWSSGLVAAPQRRAARTRSLAGSSEPLFNGVFRAHLIPDAVDGAIAETLARVASRR